MKRNRGFFKGCERGVFQLDVLFNKLRIHCCCNESFHCQWNRFSYFPSYKTHCVRDSPEVKPKDVWKKHPGSPCLWIQHGPRRYIDGGWAVYPIKVPGFWHPKGGWNFGISEPSRVTHFIGWFAYQLSWHLKVWMAHYKEPTMKPPVRQHVTGQGPIIFIKMLNVRLQTCMTHDSSKIPSFTLVEQLPTTIHQSHGSR